MKKVLVLLYLILYLINPAFTICDYTNFCPLRAYDLSSDKVQVISNKTGVTLLSEKIAQARIKRQLKQITNQKFNVEVKTYSFLDLLQGRSKSIVIYGENLSINGVYLSSLKLNTLCDFNYVMLDKKPIIFKDNMVVGFSTLISDDDLRKTMKSTGYLDKLNCVNVRGCGITFFKLSGAGVNIKNNKLYFKVKVTSELLLEKPLDINMSTDLKAENGRIVLTKVNTGNIVQGIGLSKVTKHLASMNPLTFSLEVLENKNTKMCIQNVEIVGNKIVVKGNIFIPKTERLTE